MSAEGQAAYEKASMVRQAYQEMLMAKRNVVGVGVGFQEVGGVRTDKIALVVLVRQKLPPGNLAAGDIIPAEIEGIPVDVQEVGELRANFSNH